MKIAGNNMVQDRPGMRIGVQSDVEPYFTIVYPMWVLSMYMYIGDCFARW